MLDAGLEVVRQAGGIRLSLHRRGYLARILRCVGLSGAAPVQLPLQSKLRSDARTVFERWARLQQRLRPETLIQRGVRRVTGKRVARRCLGPVMSRAGAREILLRQRTLCLHVTWHELSSRAAWRRASLLPPLIVRVSPVGSSGRSGIVDVALQLQVRLIGIGLVDLIPRIGFDRSAFDLVIVRFALADAPVAPLRGGADRDGLLPAFFF